MLTHIRKPAHCMKTIFFILTLSCGLLSGCTMDNTKSSQESDAFEFHGLLKQQGITTYQYGTHTISNSTKTYALKSSTINLDTYIDKNVTVEGTKIDGYPIDGGPEFIDVKAVR